jgi:antitoxin component of MazEF toxin-antitoxin module
MRGNARSSTLSKWEDYEAMKIPPDILSDAGFVPGDDVFFKIENERIIITKTDSPKEGTLEYLFKDYDCETFQTSLIDLGDPVGNEKW